MRSRHGASAPRRGRYNELSSMVLFRVIIGLCLLAAVGLVIRRWQRGGWRRASAARVWNEILWTLFPIAILAVLAWRYGV